MSKNRDIPEDQRRTAELLAAIRNRPNWLGHTQGAANIDAALLFGATMEQLNTYRDAVEEHFRHLRVDHGLAVTQIGDLYSFE